MNKNNFFEHSICIRLILVERRAFYGFRLAVNSSNKERYLLLFGKYLSAMRVIFLQKELFYKWFFRRFFIRS